MGNHYHLQIAKLKPSSPSLAEPSNRLNLFFSGWYNPLAPTARTTISGTFQSGPSRSTYCLAQRHAGMTLRELGKFMGEVEYRAVRVAIARFQNRAETRTPIARQSKTDREIVES